MLQKTDSERWESLGCDQIAVTNLDPWDYNRLGLTSVSLYTFYKIKLLITSCRHSLPDDAILLPLDFPPTTKAKDFYRISGQEIFKLETQKKRVCSTVPKNSTLALALASM